MIKDFRKSQLEANEKRKREKQEFDAWKLQREKELNARNVQKGD